MSSTWYVCLPPSTRPLRFNHGFLESKGLDLPAAPPFSAKDMAPPSTAAALAKWWLKHLPARGLVQRTLSPMEHNVIGSLFKNGAQKVRHCRYFTFTPGFAWRPLLRRATGSVCGLLFRVPHLGASTVSRFSFAEVFHVRMPLSMLAENVPVVVQVQKRVTGSILDFGPPVLATVGVIWWSDHTFHDEALKHRS